MVVELGRRIVRLGLLCSLMLCSSVTLGNTKGKTRTEFITVLEGVSGDIPKRPDGKVPVIECDLVVNSIDSINEANMDFTVDLSLHFAWESDEIVKLAGRTNLEFDHLDLDSQNMKSVWVPDIYFPNEKKAAVHEVMMPNKMLRIYSSGLVYYVIRVQVTLSCRMNLRKYPFDKQVCSILIESFGYTFNKLRLRWHPDNPVDNKIKELRQFRLEYTNYSSYTREHVITGRHSCLQTDFHLVRNIGYYVVQMYIPSLLIVMLSWLSFWLNANSIPGRVTLGVLSVLTLSTQSSGVAKSLPRVSYTKAIDIWMATCLVFAFCALIEFAVVNVLSTSVTMGRRFSLATLFVLQKDQEEKEIHLNQKTETTVDQSGKVSGPKNRAIVCSRNLDISSRAIFPISFGIFNLVYWLYYLNV